MTNNNFRKMKFILSLLILIFSSLLQAQSVSYKLSMPKPQNHYFHVEMELEDFNEKKLIFLFPSGLQDHIWLENSQRYQYGKSIR